MGRLTGSLRMPFVIGLRFSDGLPSLEPWLPLSLPSRAPLPLPLPVPLPLLPVGLCWKRTSFFPLAMKLRIDDALQGGRMDGTLVGGRT